MVKRQNIPGTVNDLVYKKLKILWKVFISLMEGSHKINLKFLR